MDKHGLSEFRMNPNFPMNTIMIQRGLVAAQELGVADDYIEAGLTAMWEQEKKIDDPEVLMSVWQEAGLDADKLAEMIQADAIKDKLDVEVGETTEDDRFTLVELECIGACGGAPAMLVDDTLHENVAPADVGRLLDEVKDESH